MYSKKGILHLFKIPISTSRMELIPCNGRETLEQLYNRLPHPKPDILMNGSMFDYKGGWPTGGVKAKGKYIVGNMGVMGHVLKGKGKSYSIDSYNDRNFINPTRDDDWAVESYPILLPTFNSSGLNHGLVNYRHPRSAVGLSDLYIHLLVTDGRNVSSGITTQQARNELKGHGAEYAINLDGGSSTKALAYGFQINNQNVNSAIINAVGIWFDTPHIPSTTLRKGNRGFDVGSLQVLLRNAGVYNMKIDGDFGNSTDSALKNFQMKHKLVADGIAGSNTWNMFRSPNSPITPPPPTPSPSKEETSKLPQVTLRRGAKGNDVIILQTELHKLGFYNMKIDGDFGNGTHNTVVNFQSKHGLVSDGIVGKMTWAKLEDILSKKSNSDDTETNKNPTTSNPVEQIDNDLKYRVQHITKRINTVPGDKMNPKYLMVHTTNNFKPSANAEMHRRFLNQTSSSVSFNLVVDDVEAIELVDLNLVTYHAGDGRKGYYNSQSISMEICVHNLVNGKLHPSTYRNAVLTAAKTVKDHNVTLKQHRDVPERSWKNCPHTDVLNYKQFCIDVEKVVKGESVKFDQSKIEWTGQLLRKGDIGNLVKDLQLMLIELGYLTGQADGAYGNMTRDAVIKLQKELKLTVDGIAGQQTYVALTKKLITKKEKENKPLEKYSVEVDGFNVYQDAETLKKELKKMGYSPIIKKEVN